MPRPKRWREHPLLIEKMVVADLAEFFGQYIHNHGLTPFDRSKSSILRVHRDDWRLKVIAQF